MSSHPTDPANGDATASRPFAECHTEYANTRHDIWLHFDETSRVYRVNIRHHDGFEASRDEIPLCHAAEETPRAKPLPTVSQYLAAPTEDSDVLFIQAAIRLHAGTRTPRVPRNSREDTKT